VRFAWRPQRALHGDDASHRPRTHEGADDPRGPGADRAPPTPAVAVTLWTGSGEPGVPRGLLVGTALLPLGPGPHIVLVEQCEGARDPRGLAVRTAGATEVAP
jgi:hypothetical protein